MRGFIMLVLAVAYSQKTLVTKQYTDYLKKHVTWEVMDYEDNIFRGWTEDEIKSILVTEIPLYPHLSLVKAIPNLPSSLNWAKSNCNHGTRDQGNCGSSWAFAASGMLSDRCCMRGHDHGWLSPQELISCDTKNKGCNGGWCYEALQYVKAVGGLVPESCYPYTAKNERCPTQCANGSEWKAAHVCSCPHPNICLGVDSMRTCLQSGPITVAFGVCRSFISYKSGIYMCDCDRRFIGVQSALAMGYSDEPAPNFYIRNSWGENWGNKGYFSIGPRECGISENYPGGNIICDRVVAQTLSLISGVLI